MNQQAIISDIEQRARASGVSMAALCKSAGVHPTTFSRWKKTRRNPAPIGANLAKIEKLYAVLKELDQGQAKHARRRRIAA